MSMSASGMSSYIISQISGLTNQSIAITTFGTALGNYIVSNATITYSWIGAMTVSPYTTDPTTSFLGTVSYSSTLSFSDSSSTTATSALANFSTALNTFLATFVISPPVGFVLTPMLVIPSISLTASGATTQSTALQSLCAEIISSLSCTITATGTHSGTYTGTATLVSIS
jgi:hypothetical protein